MRRKGIEKEELGGSWEDWGVIGTKLGGNGRGMAEWKGSRRNWEEKGRARGRIRAGFPLFIDYSSLWVCYSYFLAFFAFLSLFLGPMGEGVRGGQASRGNDSKSFKAMRKPWNS